MGNPDKTFKTGSGKNRTGSATLLVIVFYWTFYIYALQKDVKYVECNSVCLVTKSLFSLGMYVKKNSD